MAKAGRSMVEKAPPSKATPSKRKVSESAEGAATPRKRATPRKKSVGTSSTEAVPRRTPRKTPVKTTPGKGRGRKSLSLTSDSNQLEAKVGCGADSASPAKIIAPAPVFATLPSSSHAGIRHIIAAVVLSAAAGWFVCRLACGSSETPKMAGAPSLASRPPVLEVKKKEVVDKIRQRMESKLVFA
mmetsp:Transcript_12801/g.29798  ORF Transcript_12801/g.29798 Transcript_12801/m.29798 type:complete len:185 (-) Transcript_12801:354-908(-)